MGRIRPRRGSSRVAVRVRAGDGKNRLQLPAKSLLPTGSLILRDLLLLFLLGLLILGLFLLRRLGLRGLPLLGLGLRSLLRSLRGLLRRGLLFGDFYDVC